MPLLHDCCDRQAVLLLLLGWMFSVSARCLFELGAKDRRMAF
jgi:hypothetical protein